MLRLTPVDAVLFDLDGTLVDSAPDLGAAVDQMRVARGLPSYPLAHYRSHCGAGARGLLGAGFGITPADADFAAMREEFFSNYAACLTQRTHAFAGIENLLEVIQAKGLPWGVVTNKAMRFTDPMTRAMPLFASAAVVISGDTTPHAKPHPEPLLEACRRIGVDPQRCVYVGDDARDVSAGKAAGMYTVAARYGYLGAGSDVQSWGAHACIDAPRELLQLLDWA